MLKKLNLLILLLIGVSFTSSVNADNIVDYKLIITDDYKFKEEIKYELTDYQDYENGYNHFADIVNDDVFVDLLYNTKYKKTKKLENNKYYVTLSYTYNEYTFSNSLLLNNCFQNEKYEYDMDQYSFSGTGGFNCLNGDKLTITVLTNFDVFSTNAKIVGNKYIWEPTSGNFVMNMKMNKMYSEEHDVSDIGHGDNEHENIGNEYEEEEEQNNPTVEEVEDESTEKDDGFNFKILFVCLGIFVTIGIVIFGVLFVKKNSINRV